MKFSQMPYQRTDAGAAAARLRDLTARMAAARTAAEAFAAHDEYYALTGGIETNRTLANIRHDIDSADAFYADEQKFYDGFGPVLHNLQVEYGRQLLGSPFRPELEKKLGAPAFKNIELALRANDERLIPLRQAENELASRYQDLLAGARIEFEGGVYNLSLLRPFLTHADRATRQKAWAALSGYLRSVTDEIDDIYDQMVKNRTEQARILGFENFVPLGYLRMQRNCYGQREVEAFRAQVKQHFVPFATRLHEQRRRRLGVDKLCHYDNDVYFAAGNPAPTGTPDEIMAAGRAMYAELSPETREFMDFMCENELFDVLSRPNKHQGGYMTYLPNYKSPFIFANFNGTNGDVDVITHECGHAFQGYLLRGDPYREHADIGMETAEIHSMSMEYFTYGWMDRFFGPGRDTYLQMHLEDSVTFVPYGTMVDEFQHIVYSQPGLTPAERKQAWAELERQYRPHLHFAGDDFLAGAIWQRQHHIFTDPFYYIDYCLAGVVAMQFKVRMDKDRSAAWADYLKLCRLSAKDYYLNVLAAAGLESPFADGCLERLVKELEPKTKQ